MEEILGIYRSFSAFIHDWDKLSTGNLTLGGSNLFSSWILPPLISAFVTCYPHIKINLIEESTAQLAELLQKGSVDLILDNTALNPDIFDSRIFHEEHLILAVPSHFPINASLKDYQITDLQIQNGSFLNPSFPIVPLKSFKGLPFIMMKNENDTGKRARQICQANDFEPDVILNMDQQMTAYNICQSGMGISFIGDIMLSRIPHNHNVVYYKLPAQHNSRRICFYWKKGRYFTKAMEEFLNMSCK